MPQTNLYQQGSYGTDVYGLPYAVQGSGGGITIGMELWRTDIDGNLLEDLSDVFVRGYVDWRYGRSDGLFGSATGSALAGEFTLRDVRRVQPLADYLSPFLLLSYDDGRSDRREQLGVFAVDVSGEEHTATTGEVTLAASDLTSVLRQTFFTGTAVSPAGANFAGNVRTIIENGGITRHNIRDTAKTLGYDRVFRSTYSRLAAANKLLHAIGYYRLFADRDGTLTSLPYRSFKHTQPSATYTAADPIDVLSVTPQSPVANTVIVYAQRQGRSTLKSIAQNTDPADPLSVTALGRQIVYGGGPVTVDDVEDQDSLDEIAANLLEDAGAYQRVITMQVLPDPKPDILRTVDLFLGGDKAHLDGRYSLRGWRVGFVPDDAAMTLELHKSVSYQDLTEEAA